MIANYIDDLFFACKDFSDMTTANITCTELAQRLGVTFKKEKEEGLSTPTQAIEWIGFLIDTRGDDVTV